MFTPIHREVIEALRKADLDNPQTARCPQSARPAQKADLMTLCSERAAQTQTLWHSLLLRCLTPCGAVRDAEISLPHLQLFQGVPAAMPLSDKRLCRY